MPYHFNILLLLLFLTFARFSFQAECSNQNVTLKATEKFKIQYDPNDLTPKTCRYMFSVPKYYIPEIIVSEHILNGDDRITIEQYTNYGGKIIQTLNANSLNKTVLWDLYPSDFSLELNLLNRSPAEKFAISIELYDKTPDFQNLSTFQVLPDNVFLFDSIDINGDKVYQQNNALSDYAIRITLFGEFRAVEILLKNIHIYDEGNFMGSLAGIYLAGLSSKICKARNITIVNTNKNNGGSFTVLISPKYGFPGSVNVIAAISGDQTLSATNGPVVFHEITSMFAGFKIPKRLTNITIRGNEQLNVFAGCVTTPLEDRRIATIEPDDASNYNDLTIYGRCRTFVLKSGVVTRTSFNSPPGQKGVIMSATFPDSGWSQHFNYLIQAEPKTLIFVDYEVAYMGPEVTLNIIRYIKAENTQKFRFGPDEPMPAFLSVADSYQQMIDCNVPKETNGVLIRYTVKKSQRGAMFIIPFLIVLLSFNN
ncbi:unnamed protein product [Caenorhabditis bovis]|uniref:CUB-like domain-containing protein n=1 Tax=Caenorhabditis bovis TaxID=2654633 RepID=A0A8S1F1M5_9PELO|nr:unnamed protein product [Caenorhabditis bovis]